MTNHTVTYRAVYTVTIDGVEHELKRKYPYEDRDLSKQINYAINRLKYPDTTEFILDTVMGLTE